MINQLERLSQYTTVVADTGDIEAIKKFKPQDATTNPSLILKAANIKEYSLLIDEAIFFARENSKNIQQQVTDAIDILSVNIGKKILEIIPGRVSTEVDARLSYDTDASIIKARKLISLYNKAGIKNDRVLIKLASTWEGIRAAEILEKEGINCNLTLLFSFSQARACAEANVFLISPFVGRIMDWHSQKTGQTYSPAEDPGVNSVAKIFKYYKENNYKTVVMGASFRNKGEVLELAGCDRLTISPPLLEELSNNTDEFECKLHAPINIITRPVALTESEFRWQHNQDPMAIDKLAEGIRNFAADTEKLEIMIKEKLQ